MLILFNSTGYFIYHSVYKQQIQSEVKSLLKNTVPAKQLERIFIAYQQEDQLFWTKKDKEFRYQGQMYDIVHTLVQGDGTLYLCIHDFKESKLFAHLDEHIYNYVAHSAEHRNKHQKAFKNFSLNYLFSINTMVFNIRNAEELDYPPFNLFLASRDGLVPDPPPRM